MTDAELINRCVSGEIRAQKLLFDTYSRRMMGICLRYAADLSEAEDMMQEGWIKVFKNLSMFRFEGSFEGWIKRIMVNTSLDYLRKNKKLGPHIDEDEAHEVQSQEPEASDTMSAKELMKIIQRLPTGYRTVFNLFAIEGFSHKEIAAMLNITENTSKSQYSRARGHLQKMIQLESVY